MALRDSLVKQRDVERSGSGAGDVGDEDVNGDGREVSLPSMSTSSAGDAFGSIWECISVLLGSRCEHMRLMSRAMDCVREKEAAHRDTLEQNLLLQDRIDELSERLSNTITEDDWLEAKEESSLLRDRISKLNEKYECLVQVNTGHGKEKRRLAAENDKLRQELHAYGTGADSRQQTASTLEGGADGHLDGHHVSDDSGAAVHSRLKNTIQEQSDTIDALRAQLEVFKKSAGVLGGAEYDLQGRGNDDGDSARMEADYGYGYSFSKTEGNPISHGGTATTSGRADGGPGSGLEVDEGMLTVQQFLSTSDDIGPTHDAAAVRDGRPVDFLASLQPSSAEHEHDVVVPPSTTVSDSSRDADPRRQGWPAATGAGDARGRGRSRFKSVMVPERSSNDAFSSAMYRRASMQVSTPRHPH